MAHIKDLTKIEQAALKKVLEKYQNSVYLKGDAWDGVSAKLGYHRINLKTDQPINIKQYKLPYKLEKIVEDQVQEWIKMGICEESNSEFNCPLYAVPKPDDRHTGAKRWRIVTDFRALNQNTITEEFPMPSINDLFDRIGKGNKYFTKIDLSNGFLQIPIDPRDRHKMAFTTNRGKYQFTRMPFGLKNAPFFFQRAMNKILAPLINKGILVYLDDILIHTQYLEEHMDLLSQVLELLRKHNFKVEVGKCDFLKREVTYLGHIVTKDGIKPDPSKIKAVQKFLPPENQKHIRMFLGLCGFYRRFIKNFAHTTKCLSDLLKKDSPFIWTNEHQKAFEMLKQKLCEAPILTYPDIQGEYLLIVDASAKCLGGVLAQGTEKKHNPISYWSRVLTQTEQKYSAYEREALAIYEAVKHFRQYLYASRFIILSDHKPLLSMAEAENNARVQRWRLKLQGYDYTIKHIVGKSNVIADSLSRLPTEICCTKLCKQKRKNKNKRMSQP